MAALTADRNTLQRENNFRQFPVEAAKKIYAGAIVVLNAAGYAEPGTTALAKVTVGRAEAQADNSGGAQGAINVDVRRGLFRFNNSAAGDLIDRTFIGSTCFIVDDNTVAKTNGGSTRSSAGVVRDVDAQGVWVEIA